MQLEEWMGPRFGFSLDHTQNIVYYILSIRGWKFTLYPHSSFWWEMLLLTTKSCSNQKFIHIMQITQTWRLHRERPHPGYEAVVLTPTPPCYLCITQNIPTQYHQEYYHHIWLEVRWNNRSLTWISPNKNKGIKNSSFLPSQIKHNRFFFFVWNRKEAQSSCKVTAFSQDWRRDGSLQSTMPKLRELAELWITLLGLGKQQWMTEEMAFCSFLASLIRFLWCTIRTGASNKNPTKALFALKKAKE